MGLYTYPDASLILESFSKDITRAKRACAILEDPLRCFMVSDYIWLETMPKMLYNKQLDQMQYTAELFRRAECIPNSATIILKAREIASLYGLAAMDALHVASAIIGGADELVTFEKPTKPFFRIPPEVLRITSLYETP